MRHIVAALVLITATGQLAGCGSSQPDEAQLHKILSGPPHRPRSQGVGLKRLEQKGGVAPQSPG